MKTKFSRSKELLPDFNGNKGLPAEEQIKYKVTPMELGDFYDVLDQLSKVTGAKVGDEPTAFDPAHLSSDGQKEFMVVCQGFVHKYVTSIGAKLEDDAGAEVTVHDIARYAAFISLLSEFVVELLSISTPTEAEVKN